MTTLLNPWKNRRKKARAILSVVLVATISSKVIATDGLYAGVGLGNAFMYGKLKNASLLEDRKMRKNGHVANAFVGYSHTLQGTPMFVGLELAAINHAMKKRISGTYPADYRPYSFALSTNNSLHAHLRIGVTVSNLSFYAKGGVAQTNFKTSYSVSNQERSHNFIKYGASTGFGVESRINKNFSLGVEHVYTSYGSLSNVAPNLGVQDFRHKVTEEIHLTSLRLIYNF